jgi:fructose-bisphosphate aldolase class II
MTLANLRDVLTPCLTDGTAVAGMVVLGWEDAQAYVRAAEALGRPVILQAGPGCRAHTPLPVLGAMFRALAEGASVPVVAHLDHGESLRVCQEACDSGFTSVMFDGSAMNLPENIERTAEIVQWAHGHGLSVEAELGFVGYQGGAQSQGTDPGEVARFARETRVDALAVAVGNCHLMTSPRAGIDIERLMAIQSAAPDLPLVLHGGSGIDTPTRQFLAGKTHICKMNIGTELRMAFGAALRSVLARDPALFDRNKILEATTPPMIAAARQAITTLCLAGQVL